MGYIEFIAGWGTRQRERWERPGQSLFNHLHDVRPDLAEQLRNTQIDPYYNDAAILHALTWIYESWSPSPATSDEEERS